MRAETIAVGSELLLGQISNTNAQIISRALQEIGVDVYYHTCVGDNEERIKQVFKIALERSDVIIFTGGLGPTLDDLTKETVSSFLNLPLQLDEPSLERIKDYFKKKGKPMTQNNYKQALLPEGSSPILNRKGTAPGVLLKYGEKIIIMLPGPPFEMEPMLAESVIPYLAKLSQKTIFSRVLKFYGIGESLLEEKIKDLIVGQSNPTIAPLAKMGEVTLRITAKAEDIETARNLIMPVEEEIVKRVGQYLYGFDNESIEEIVAGLLLTSKKSISIAESCTGGLMAHKLTNIPGISEVFERGVVSYSNRAKQELLNVKAETLGEYGAVSEQTAMEMARGIRITANTDIGVSITGIAGPGGGSPEKPVGLVYIGYADSKTVIVEKHLFTGDRMDIKQRSVDAALHMVRRMLKGSGD
ncbi:MAG: nicotinamide-nucleotide amidase [Thermoanaerobacteraceae bacterium]|jgi:nicotinamide-nucleotide amidase|nr:nicotinamide-nucleotide amidase [Thermoanaerobacteraceae bacterium]MDN5301656.1 nicotinamide-nucleotide amidase [Thermoanaerobacteraceae bacterium]